MVAVALTRSKGSLVPRGWQLPPWPLLRVMATVALTFVVVAADSPPGFDHDRLTIESAAGRFDFQVELATTPDQRAYGLMFRDSLSDDHGMLFDFGHPQPVAMWMRNTYISLDMLFIRADGRIGRIVHGAQPLSDKVLDSGEPVRAVLELRGGLTAELGIEPGDRVACSLFSSSNVRSASPQ